MFKIFFFDKTFNAHQRSFKNYSFLKIILCAQLHNTIKILIVCDLVIIIIFLNMFFIIAN